MNAFNITLYTADNGIMAKTFGITDGKVTQQHPGLISAGHYQIWPTTLKELLLYFKNMHQNQALGLGMADQEKGRIVTKSRHEELEYPDDPIPRNKEHFKFRPEPTAVLLDVDGVAESIDVVAALSLVIPGFAEAEKLIASSSSSGLYLNGNSIKNSTSKHIYIVVKDGTDIPRFMRVLFKWLWIFGLGRIVISAAGTMLERSLIDPTVAAPERIIYEAKPVLNDGITQVRNDPKHIPGTMLNTSQLLDLTSQDEAEYQKLVAKAKESHQADADMVAREHDQRQAELVAEATGMPPEAAKRTVESRRNGQISPDDIIYLNKNTPLKVSEITRDHHGQTCCDPLEPSYNNWHNTVAIIYVNDNGSVKINSMAHGGAKYHVRDADPNVVFGTGASEGGTTSGEIIHKLSDMLIKRITAEDWFPVIHDANLKPTGLDEVFDYLGGDPRMMSSKAIIKREYKNRAADADAADKMHRLTRMAKDEEKVLIRFIPQDINNGVLETEKAMIDIPGQWSYFNYGGMLAYTADDIPSWKATGIDDTEPPKVQVIKRYNRNSLFLRIEQSVKNYQEKKDGPVSIPVPQEIINKLIDHPSPLAPKVSGLISHPIITLDGRVIFSEGIDEQTGLLFEFGGTTFLVPGTVDNKLAGEWVNWISDRLFSEFIFLRPAEGTVTALAFLMTGVFRKVLDIAPGVMVKANMQGSGKTTLAQFIHVTLTGRNMPVSGLGSSPDEMKKEMLATLIQSPAMVCYDNILDGSEIRDQVLAKVLTAPHLKGRLLGETREVTVPTNSLLVMTGNNITLSADLVRRFMTIELTADDAQPEGRTFRTPDVVQHCLNHRSDVLLGCLIITKGYIDAGSPELSKPGSGFREWDRMVRFPLLWATGVDVLNAIKSNKEQSTEHIAMNGLMSCLAQLYPKQQPFSSSDLLTRLSTENKWLQNSELLDQTRECITNMSVKGLKDTRSLSWVLKKMEGRLINGKKLKYTANSAGNYGKFMVTG